MRYYIEQQPRRFYNSSELKSAKTRARKLTALYDLVYVIAEQYDDARKDYAAVGSICFANGLEVGVEGCVVA